MDTPLPAPPPQGGREKKRELLVPPPHGETERRRKLAQDKKAPPRSAGNRQGSCRRRWARSARRSGRRGLFAAKRAGAHAATIRATRTSAEKFQAAAAARKGLARRCSRFSGYVVRPAAVESFEGQVPARPIRTFASVPLLRHRPLGNLPILSVENGNVELLDRRIVLGRITVSDVVEEEWGVEAGERCRLPQHIFPRQFVTAAAQNLGHRHGLTITSVGNRIVRIDIGQIFRPQRLE